MTPFCPPSVLPSVLSQPATQPDNGLAMTDSEIHARLEALNSKPPPAFDAQRDLARRRQVYLQNEQNRLTEVQAQGARNHAAIAAADQALPQIQSQLPVAQARADAANWALQSLIQARDNAIGEAVNASNGTFVAQGVDPDSGRTVEVTGEFTDPAAVGVETQLINAQYAPQIQSAQRQADVLNAQLGALQQQAQALTNVRQAAIRDTARVANVTSDAQGAIARAAAATTVPASR